MSVLPGGDAAGVVAAFSEGAAVIEVARSAAFTLAGCVLVFAALVVLALWVI